WRATVVFALLIGLAAGIATAMVGAGRRTATAYDRFTAYADVPELIANFCPPDFSAEEGSLTECYLYDAEAERDTIAALPEVEAASRGWFRGVSITPIDDPGDSLLASAFILQDEGIASPAGRYLVVEGADASGASEVVVNEHLADAAGIEVGDRIELTFWAPDELGSFADDATFHGPSVEVRVAGIGRAISDLAATSAATGSADEQGVLYGGPALAAATETAAGYGGVLIDVAGDDLPTSADAVQEAFPGRDFNLLPSLGDDEVEPTRDAIRYEAQALTTLGIVVAIVIAAFVAQALARQSRREWSDGPALRAVGVTRRLAVSAALVRSLAISLPAIAVATITAIAVSPLGPIGQGRSAEVDPGVHVDPTALLVGALGVALTVTLGITAPLLRGRVLRTAPRTSGRTRDPRDVPLPPVLSMGLQFARRTPSGSVAEVGTALIGVGAAVAIGIAAAGLMASFDDLTHSPARFGAPWDVSLGRAGENGSVDAEQLLAERSDLRAEIAEAAVLTGTDMQMGDQTGWVHAFVPMEGVAGVVDPPIIDGRAPANEHEIAVGAVTLRKLGLAIGDPVTMTSVAGGRVELDIVGVAVINDNFEKSPGRGAVVSPDLIAKAAPEVASGDPLVLRLRDGVDVQAFTDEVAALYEGPVQGPVEPEAVRNVGRIRQIPALMAAVVAVLAIASLIHALVLAVGRNRRVLGVLKSIGFTRRQVGGAVACHAMAFAVLALVVAVPLGIMVGRWGWRLVAEGLGVAAVPVIPPVAVLAVALGALVLANVAAAYPAWRAAHLRTALALRSE
ncbi:MAG: FtsX-like permease family protein, partial [Acidimicrobiales bacterium]